MTAMHETIVLVRLLATTLAATIALELPLAVVLFGVRGRREMAVVALAQVATNPLVELLCVMVRWHLSLPLTDPAWAALLAAELAAVVVESLLYRIADISDHPWRMSVALNTVSLAVGLLAA